MWIIYAFGSALFAGITSILAKCGIKNTNSNVATALRTIVVLLFAWPMVFITGSQNTIKDIDAKSLVFLILSGLTTGASWICYFKALQTGDINKVVPIDKSSTVISIIFAVIFLREELTAVKFFGIIGIAMGTYLMLDRKKYESKTDTKPHWLIYALLSALFAAITSILGKIGISGVESNLGTAIRTVVVLIMAWALVFISGEHKEIKDIDKKELCFIALSGVATGASWLCYYRALQQGPASVVVPIDKLSILVTVAFSAVVFKEKLSKKALVGLALITAGTLIMLV